MNSWLERYRMRKFIKKVVRDNKELLDRLGSDYDEHGVPYWEKTGIVDPDYKVN